jgi:hypothetical protein
MRTSSAPQALLCGIKKLKLGLCLQFRSPKGLSLKESLAQYSCSMTAQTDLRVEYAHIKRFFVILKS